MPMIDVKLPTGALDAEARRALGDRLAGTLLKWEKAPDNETTRSITWVYFHELELHVGGPNGDSPHYHVLVTVPEGALSDRRKAGLVEEATQVVLDAEGTPADAPFEDKVRVWVHVHEVPEGHWGAAGQIFRFKDIVRAVNGDGAAVAAAS